MILTKIFSNQSLMTVFKNLIEAWMNKWLDILNCRWGQPQSLRSIGKDLSQSTRSIRETNFESGLCTIMIIRKNTWDFPLSDLLNPNLFLFFVQSQNMLISAQNIKQIVLTYKMIAFARLLLTLFRYPSQFQPPLVNFTENGF